MKAVGCSLLVLCLFSPAAQAAAGRYLTWVDDLGRVHNTFVDSRYAEQQRQAEQRISLSDEARQLEDQGARWPGAKVSGEAKRRYFTWVDGSGSLQNSFYAQDPAGGQGRDFLLNNGEHSGAYIDAEVLEGKGFVRSENGTPYYTWVDEQGRMRNSGVPTDVPASAAAPGSQVRYTEGRQVEFSRPAASLPGLDGQSSEALQELLGDDGTAEGIYAELVNLCCEQMSEDDFTELSADEPRYEEINNFSPSFKFPMGQSYYAAVKLPPSLRTYGLRVRSFANQQVVYPSLLFLDQHKRPTRLVSDAVYQLHGETWYRYAFIEGTVPVQADRGERYVLLLTTDEDRSLKTLDNKPFKRPLQDLAVNETGMQVHEHADQGSFELAIVR